MVISFKLEQKAERLLFGSKTESKHPESKLWNFSVGLTVTITTTTTTTMMTMMKMLYWFMWNGFVAQKKSSMQRKAVDRNAKRNRTNSGNVISLAYFEIGNVALCCYKTFASMASNLNIYFAPLGKQQIHPSTLLFESVAPGKKKCTATSLSASNTCLIYVSRIWDTLFYSAPHVCAVCMRLFRYFCFVSYSHSRCVSLLACECVCVWESDVFSS